MSGIAGANQSGEGLGPDGSRPGRSSWRAVAVPVALAVVLSVAATLLLGGVLRPAGAGPAWLGANGPGRACCLPGEPAGGSR